MDSRSYGKDVTQCTVSYSYEDSVRFGRYNGTEGGGDPKNFYVGKTKRRREEVVVRKK